MASSITRNPGESLLKSSNLSGDTKNKYGRSSLKLTSETNKNDDTQTTDVNDKHSSVGNNYTKEDTAYREEITENSDEEANDKTKNNNAEDQSLDTKPLSKRKRRVAR